MMFKKGLVLAVVVFISLGMISCDRSGDSSNSGSEEGKSSTDDNTSKKQADPKGKVVLYCSADQVLSEPMIDEFEKSSGIDVDVRFETEASKTDGFVQKIRDEADKPVADVFWSNEVFHTINLAREGLLDSYTSEKTKNWPKEFTGKNNTWYGFGLRARVIAYNADRVSEDAAPKTLEDTLSSKWKGRLAMATPEFGTTGGDVASWFAHYGQERAVKYLEALKANDVMIVAGNSTAVKKVATGQADICFTDTDDVYAAQRDGWNVKMNMLSQNGMGPLVIPNTATVIKDAPNKENAALLMDFLLSKRLEEALVQSDSHNSPIHPELQEKYYKYVILNPLKISYEDVADQLDKAIQKSREILH